MYNAPNYYEYECSKRISAEGWPFYALLCAAFSQADSDNLARLQAAFPEEFEVFKQRYHNHGGLSNAEIHRLDA